jgi:hypothetical protein
VSYVRAGPPIRFHDGALEPVFDQARGLFERFHCFEPDVVVRSRCRRIMPDVVVRLGQLRGVIYTSDRGQRGCPRTFVHFFERPPTLASDCRGEQMFILGGRYRITRSGIEG